VLWDLARMVWETSRDVGLNEVINNGI
jgi:hypothetical protein